ncbi:MAG: Gfo/Idh/MocA family oxidoreductase [Verrucomicrobiales bacterium]|nr:Gfo/Idh/MocA family oxidoreductase [Verrucomicrobiales bacterium]
MTFRIAGINFDHFHMGDLLRMAHHHPAAEIVGICDRQACRMEEARENFAISDDRVFTDYRRCLEVTKPDLVILCPAAARHAEWTEKVAAFDVPILMEKPFASTLSEADRMISAMKHSGQPLAINWPLAWCRSHVKCHEVIQSEQIGAVTEVHFYDGNRGPLWHGADKIEKEPSEAEKSASWFYKDSEGGGSLQDYLGYGTTLGTWFNGGQKPIEVMAMWDRKNGAIEVDQHSVVVARYASGLSKFETRWGTFSDPWTHQPQPKCGFVIKGTGGTISSYDYDEFVTVQTFECPAGKRVEAEALMGAQADPVAYFIDCLENGRSVEGPLSPAVSRIGQQIVDTAFESAKAGRSLRLRGD